MNVKARNNPVSGAGYFFRGLSLITQKGVKRYVVIPLLINILLFAIAIYLVFAQLPLLLAWIAQVLPPWLIWLSWLLIPLFVIATTLAVLLSFTVIGNLIAAPFNGRLAEAVEEKLTGKAPATSGNLNGLVRDVFGGLYSEIQKLAYFGLRAIPLLILLVIPGLSLLGSVLWPLFSSWMLALEYTDYPSSNHGLDFRSQRQLMRKKRLLGLGYGGMMTLALLVPGLNLLLIPAGVAGATAMWVEQLSVVANTDGDELLTSRSST